MKLTVIIPVYNEKKTIQEILRRVAATDLADEILVVDDGSTDGTRDILTELDGLLRCRVIYHVKNKGKGAAVRTGIEQARGDVLLIQDADLEYNPQDYPALLQPIEEDIADVVYGSRFLGGARRPILYWNMVANKILTFVTNILYNNILTDMETGYKVFRREIVVGYGAACDGLRVRAGVYRQGAQAARAPLRGADHLQPSANTQRGRRSRQKMVLWRCGRC